MSSIRRSYISTDKVTWAKPSFLSLAFELHLRPSEFPGCKAMSQYLAGQPSTTTFFDRMRDKVCAKRMEATRLLFPPPSHNTQFEVSTGFLQMVDYDLPLAIFTRPYKRHMSAPGIDTLGAHTQFDIINNNVTNVDHKESIAVVGENSTGSVYLMSIEWCLVLTILGRC